MDSLGLSNIIINVNIVSRVSLVWSRREEAENLFEEGLRNFQLFGMKMFHYQILII